MTSRCFQHGLVLFWILCALSVQAADFFDFSGDSTEVSLTEGREYTRLSGNAQVISDSSELKANTIEIYGEGFRYIYCEGGVSFFDTEHNMFLSAASLFHDRESSRSTAEGSIVLEDREHDLLARAVSLEIENNGERVVLQAGVKIIKDDFVIRSELAVYDRKSQELYLSGFPKVSQGEDLYEALTIVLNLDTEEVDLRGSVKGTVRPENEEEEESPATSNAPSEQDS